MDGIMNATPFQPLIIAHRGFSARGPENTLVAFELAIDCGADGIEFDVRLAKDGVPVVIHDADLKRTTGVEGWVNAATSEQLSRLDAGSWFNRVNPRIANPDFSSQSVPTLRQTLELLSEFRGLIYIELKFEDADLEPLCRAISAELEGSPLLPRIILKSFRLSALPILRVLRPEAKTAALFQLQIKTILSKEKHILTVARELGADQLSLHRSLATPKLMRAATHDGFPVTVWTVNKPRWVRRAADLGIKALITNDPEKLLVKRRTEFGR